MFPRYVKSLGAQRVGVAPTQVEGGVMLVNTLEKLADLLTKGLPRPALESLRDSMMGMCASVLSSFTFL